MHRFFTKQSAKKISFTLLSLTAVFLAVPESAHAAWFDAASNVVGSIFSLSLEVFILPLAAAIMYIAGSIMDSAINFGLHTAYIFALSPAINLGWVIIRDIANIFFIFILIYISLGTIVQGTKFGTKQLLTQVIIAALLINFSLFITKAVIDVSNVFGNWLFNGIQKTLVANTTGCSAATPADVIACKSPTSMSGLIATRLGVMQFWLGDATPNANGASGGSPITSDPTQGFIGRFLRLSVVLITTYIFLYCAILFIARSITLLFLLVFSPIGFMGSVLPQIKKYSTQWRDELLSASIFPIAFLLMLYIAMQFINSLQLINLKTLKDVTLFGINISLSQYFQYFLIIFLLQACLRVAKENSGEMGKALGGLAEGLGKLAVGVGAGLATGGTGLLLRGTVGRGAAMLARNDTIQDAAIRGNKFAKLGLTTLRGIAGGSMDIRATSIGAKVFEAGGIKKMDGFGLKPQKGGYYGDVKERIEEEKDFASKFESNLADPFAARDERIAKQRAYADSLLESKWSIEGGVGEKPWLPFMHYRNENERNRIVAGIREQASKGGKKQKPVEEALEALIGATGVTTPPTPPPTPPTPP